MARILLLASEPLFREMAAAMLRGAGHEVALMENSDTALERFVETRPELVIIDHKLSVHQGLRTIQACRLLDPHIRILAFSGGGPLVQVDGMNVTQALQTRCPSAMPFDQAWLKAVDANIKKA